MFQYIRKAQYHETDQMGVIHHANYVKWMEEARVAFMDDLGMGYERMEADGLVSPVVGIELDYRKPVRFSDEVEVRVFVRSHAGVRMEIGYEFYNRTAGTLCATGSSRHCFLKDGRIVSLKKLLPEFAAALAAASREDGAAP
ncbi:MAG: acyl-CoA thioesterase [Oscillospiraceae bacterium]|nr:acyl-CoA thioesterase [Oscillospiraceae bacterium]